MTDPVTVCHYWQARDGNGVQAAQDADSIDLLVRNNLQKMQIDMVNQVIDAGRFPSSVQARKAAVRVARVWQMQRALKGSCVCTGGAVRGQY